MERNVHTANACDQKSVRTTAADRPRDIPYAKPQAAGPELYCSPSGYIGFAIDRSGSVEDKWEEIKSALFATLASMMRHPVLRRTAKVTIVAFDSEVEVIADKVPIQDLDFEDVAKKLGMPRGTTRLGDAVVKTAKIIREAAEQFNASGRHVVFQSILALLTDGFPTTHLGELDTSLQTMQEAFELMDHLLPQHKLVVLPALIGKDELAYSVLERLVEKDPDAKVHEIQSKEDLAAFFRFIGMTAVGLAGGEDPRSARLNKIPVKTTAMGSAT